MSRPPSILLIDSHDSFTYNIWAGLKLAGAEVVVRPVETLSPAEVYYYPWQGIVIGPGPGHPSRLQALLPPLLPPNLNIPLLGICLGHQYLALAHGATVNPTGRPRFGVQGFISHAGADLFEGLPNPLPVGLYHALGVYNLPPALKVLAADADGLCMAFRHETHPIWGVQFHPDSILTPMGPQLFRRWVSFIGAQVPS
jgi:anthranilate synthase/aminodeoxychorismate synthase-like glutamine amidotransferase